MLRRFSELGSEYNFSFTSLEFLGNRIIGVDGPKGKVLFLEDEDTNPICSMIDLTEAKSCRIKKVYGNLNAGGSSARNAETYLQTITLEFDLKKGDHMVALPFYQHISDSIQEAAGLEAKAKNWEMMLSKMMTKEIKV